MSAPAHTLVAQRYQLLHKLGEGGMGVVYLAKDLASPTHEKRQNIALKFLPKHSEPTTIERFKREFTLLSRLAHPNLAVCFDFGFDQKREQFFFTCEYIPGTNLFAGTRNLALPEIMVYLVQLVKAVRYFHDQGILHNDLKPSNIYITEGQIKVLDLGLSGLRNLHAPSPTLLGTPGYLAPEIIQGQRESVQSDLYALGIVFFKILAGKLPFETKTSKAILTMTLSENIPNLRQFAPHLPRPLTDLVQRLTARKPENRPRDLQEVLKVLLRLTPTTASHPTPPFGGRKKEIEAVLAHLEAGVPFIHLTGAPGMGTSRFLRELKVELQVRNYEVALGRCLKEGETFSPWKDILGQIQTFFYQSQRSPSFTRLQAGKTETRSFVEGTSPSFNEQLILFYHYLQALKEAASVLRFVIFIEDLHFADADSLALLKFLRRARIPQLRFVVSSVGSLALGEQKIISLAPLKHKKSPIDVKPLPPVSKRNRSLLSELKLGKDLLDRKFFLEAEDHLLHVQEHRQLLDREQQRLLQETLADLYFLQGRLEKALPFISELIGDSTSKPDHVDLLVLKLMVILRERGELENALARGEKTLARLSPATGSLFHCRIFNQMAWCELQRRNYTQATEHIEKALEWSAKHPAQGFLPLFLVTAGVILSEQKNHLPQAEKKFREALTYYRKLDNQQGEAMTLQNLGFLCGKMGQTSQEKEILTQAITLARSIGDLRCLLHCLNSLGAIQLKEAELLQAQQSFEEVFEMASLLEIGPLKAKALFNLGRVFHLRARYSESQDQFRQAQALVENLKHKSRYGLDLLSWFAMNLSLGDLSAAKQILHQLEKEAFFTTNPFSQGIFHLYQAEYFSLQKDYRESLQHVEKTRRLAQELNHEDLLLDSYCVEARIYLRQQKLPAESCLPFLKRKVDLKQEQGDRLQAIHYRVLCLACEVKSKSPGNQWAAAMTHLEEENHLVLAQLPELSLEMQLLWAEYFEKNNEPLKALATLEMAKLFTDTILGNLQAREKQLYGASEQVQRVLEKIAAYRQDPRSVVQTWLAEKEQVRKLKENLRLNLQVLEQAFSFSELSKKICELALTISGERAAMVLLSSNRFIVKSSLEKITGHPWPVPKSFLHALEKDWESLARESHWFCLKNHFVFPLPRNLGFFLVEGGSVSAEKAAEIAEIFLWASPLISQELDLEEKEQQMREENTEISSLRSQFMNEMNDLPWTAGGQSLVGGRSAAMQRVMGLLGRLIPTDLPILIEGETGTGKELVAKILHENGPRSHQPFMVVSMGALSSEMLASHLFGHMKGAFTGAETDQIGILAKADGGTVFFDEVGDMQPEVQILFVKFLEENKFTPLGGKEEIQVNVRLIASTRNNLLDWVAQGKFRKDLYHRLHGVSIQLPPLRERREDIPLLLDYFLQPKAPSKTKKKLSVGALRTLYFASWPGNVRQLKNVASQIQGQKKGKYVSARDLPVDLKQTKDSEIPYPLEDAKAFFLKEYLSDLLQFAQGNVTKASRLSGIPKSTLQRHLNRFFPN